MHFHIFPKGYLELPRHQHHWKYRILVNTLVCANIRKRNIASTRKAGKKDF